MALICTAAIGWTFAMVFWSSFKRRRTWKVPWERSTSLIVWMMGVSAVGFAPTIGFPGLPIGCEAKSPGAFLGAIAALGGAVGVTWVIAHRAHVDPRQTLLHHVYIPTGLAVTALTALFVGFRLYDNQALDYFQAPLSLPAQLWWITFDIIGIWILGYTAWTLNILLEDAQHRPTGRTYIFSCIAGILTCSVGILTVTTGSRFTAYAITPMFAIWIALFALGAAQSWERKADRLYPHPLAKGTH